MDTVHSPFFVREQIQVRIAKRIEAFEKGYRQNVGLISPVGRGKSTCLRSIYTSLLANPGFLPIYVDARAIDFDSFVERWIGAVLSSLCLTQSIRPPMVFQSLLSVAQNIAPQTIEHVRSIKSLIRKGKFAASVRELFALPEVLAGETGKKIVLMVDEFHALENLPVPDAFGIFGKEIMVGKNTLYLVVSSAVSQAREIFKEKLSLLFGNFEVVELNSMGFVETSDFLNRSFPGRAFSAIQKKFFIRMTDGNPVYLELLADRLHYYLASREDETEIHPVEGGISDAKIIRAFSDELSSGYARIARIFKERMTACEQLGKDSSSYLKALHAVSCGRRKVLGIAAFIGKKTKEVKKILQRLVQVDMLAKRGSFYVLEDPLFSFWLREVFQRRLQLYVPDDAAVRDAVKAALQKEFDGLHAEETADITGRIQALFKEFRNDVVEIDQKKFCLPHFSEIAFRPSNGRVFPLLARSPKIRWLCQIAQQHISEEDVLFFLDELKHFRKNIQRKIMVAVAGIDQNAKLMAQQANIHLWDLRCFNSLLDLYDLPKMIFVEEEKHEPNMGAVAQSVHTA